MMVTVLKVIKVISTTATIFSVATGIIDTAKKLKKGDV